MLGHVFDWFVSRWYRIIFLLFLFASIFAIGTYFWGSSRKVCNENNVNNRAFYPSSPFTVTGSPVAKSIPAPLGFGRFFSDDTAKRTGIFFAACFVFVSSLYFLYSHSDRIFHSSSKDKNAGFSIGSVFETVTYFYNGGKAVRIHSWVIVPLTIAVPCGILSLLFQVVAKLTGWSVVFKLHQCFRWFSLALLYFAANIIVLGGPTFVVSVMLVLILCSSRLLYKLGFVDSVFRINTSYKSSLK